MGAEIRVYRNRRFQEEMPLPSKLPAGLGLWTLASRNLRRRPFRHGALVLCLAVGVGLQSAGVLLEEGARRGVELCLARLGADLVAVPDEYTQVLERAYMTGEAALFYMDRRVEERMAGFPFVAGTSSQVFIRSLSGAACCSAGNVFLIGFEPESDFTVRPWLARHRERSLGADEVVAGAGLGLRRGEAVRFFGHEFRVSGVLEATGSGLDSTVFIPLRTAYRMAEESVVKAEKPLPLRPDQISAVMIKLKLESAGGLPPETAARELEKGVYEIAVIRPERLLRLALSSLAGSLSVLRAAACAVWPLTALLIGLVFAMAAAERQRELGLFRSLGATRSFILRLILSEALALAVVGAGAGFGGTALIISAFSRLIAFRLEVPFFRPEPAELGRLFILSLILALLTSGISALLPAWRASRMEPYEAVRKGE